MTICSSRVLVCIVFVASAACTPDHRSEGGPTSPESLSRDDILDAGALSVAAAGPSLAFVGTDLGIVRVDASGAALLPTIADGVVAAARVDAETVLIATRDDLLVHGAVTGSATLADDVSLPVSGLAAVDGDVWLQDGRGLALFRDGWLVDVALDGEPVTGAWCAGPGRLWVSSDEGVSGLVRSADGWRVQGGLSGAPASHLAVDATGTVWAVVHGVLWARGDDGWTEQITEGEVLNLLASPGAVGAWLLTSSGWWFTDTARMRAVDVPDITSPTVDVGGRLLGVVDGQAMRWHPERRVVLDGLDAWSMLQGTTEVLLVATDEDAIDSFAATLDEDPLEVLSDPWRVVLAPGTMLPTEHALQVTATWRDGRSHSTAPVPFLSAGVEQATWADHVGPLIQRRCSVCHANGTETILANEADVEARIDAVLDAVGAGRMPLSGAKLNAAEIDLFISWKDGGFP